MDEKYSSNGALNLRILGEANNFIDWVYEEISPFLGGNILEIGSGTGTYSKKIIDNFPNNKILLSDIDTNFVTNLKKQFRNPNTYVAKIDFGKEEDFKNIPFTLDSAFALNVLEHVEDDVRALKNVYDKLNLGGRLIIFVPAHKFLFSCVDTSVGHYRRYTKKDILQKIAQTEFKVKKLFYFNFLGIIGWYWNGSIIKKEILNKNMVSFFNKLVPVFRFVERYILRKKMGISLIVVLEK